MYNGNMSYEVGTYINLQDDKPARAPIESGLFAVGTRLTFKNTSTGLKLVRRIAIVSI